MANWPQYLTIGWLLFSSAYATHKGASSGALVNIASTIAAYGVIAFVLWAGGFFAPLGFAP